MVTKKLDVIVQTEMSKRGSSYYVLKVDLGYRKAVLSVDRGLIAEVLGISVKELVEKMGKEV